MVQSLGLCSLLKAQVQYLAEELISHKLHTKKKKKRKKENLNKLRKLRKGMDNVDKRSRNESYNRKHESVSH